MFWQYLFIFKKLIKLWKLDKENLKNSYVIGVFDFDMSHVSEFMLLWNDISHTLMQSKPVIRQSCVLG